MISLIPVVAVALLDSREYHNVLLFCGVGAVDLLSRTCYLSGSTDYSVVVLTCQYPSSTTAGSVDDETHMTTGRATSFQERRLLRMQHAHRWVMIIRMSARGPGKQRDGEERVAAMQQHGRRLELWGRKSGEMRRISRRRGARRRSNQSSHCSMTVLRRKRATGGLLVR